MTLQIAMAGQDGWILASDRMRLDVGGPASVRTSSTTTKIVCTNQVAYAAAGSDEVGSITGCETVNALRNGTLSFSDPKQFADDLRKLANSVWRRVARNLKRAYQLDPSHTARGIIVCFAHFPTFLSLGIGRDSVPTWLGQMAIFGDTTNAAKFFPRRYYSAQMSVARLTFLAAHTILVGAQLNPEGVGGGLDIAICQNRSIRLLSDDEIADLTRRSAKTAAIFDEIIAEA
jgi:hypothetical protein